MSLLLTEAKPCIMYDKQTTSDGYGGVNTSYTKGARFVATIIREDEGLAKIASALTEQVTYKIYTKKNVTLQSGDIFECEDNNKFYEVLFSNFEKQTPSMSALDVRYTTAREWKGQV